MRPTSNYQSMVENTVAAMLHYLDGDMSGVVNPHALQRRPATRLPLR
jgi:hypothetical protein